MKKYLRSEKMLQKIKFLMAKLEINFFSVTFLWPYGFMALVMPCQTILTVFNST